MEESKVLVRCVLQKEDQIVICPNDWTVKRLKQHLSAVHPDKPAVKLQRLIYSGQCLSNESLIGSVLRPLHEDTPYHVMHLVHTPSKQQLIRERIEREEKESELRRRKAAPAPQSVPSQPTVPLGGTVPQYGYPYMYNLPAGQGMPNDYLQMYNEYMANYMNYMNQIYGSMATGQMGAAMGTGAPFVPPMVGQEAPAHVIAAPVVPDGPGAQGQQPAMNAAQVGIDDDEDDLRARDWLDWVYMCLRASLLITILYFYSSVERFALVMICCFLMYAVQAGWFGRRRNRNAAPPPVVAPAPDPQPVPGQQPAEQANNTDEQTNAETPPLPVAPPIEQASAWHIFWTTCYTFVTSFFASLVPEQPPPLDVN